MDPQVIETLKLVILKSIVEGPIEESVAARRAGVPWPVFQEWKRTDEGFAAALSEAFTQGTDTLATVGMERAKRKSDRLLEFFVGQRDPDRFGKDASQRRTGGGILTMTLEQLDSFLADKRRELVLAQRTVEGTAVDVTPVSES